MDRINRPKNRKVQNIGATIEPFHLRRERIIRKRIKQGLIFIFFGIVISFIVLIFKMVWERRPLTSLKLIEIPLDLKNLDLVVYGRGPTAYLTASILYNRGHNVALISPSKEIIVKRYFEGQTQSIQIPYSFRFYPSTYYLPPPTKKEIDNLAQITSLSSKTIEEAVETLFSSIHLQKQLGRRSIGEQIPLIPVSYTEQGLPPCRTISKQITSFDTISEDQISLNNGELTCRRLILADEYPIDDLGSTELIVSGLVGTETVSSSKDHSSSIGYVRFLEEDGIEKREEVYYHNHVGQNSNEVRRKGRIHPYARYRTDGNLETISFPQEGDQPLSDWLHGPLLTDFTSLRPDPKKKIWILGPSSLRSSWSPLRDSFLLAILSSSLIDS
jgi:hypothetical protein